MQKKIIVLTAAAMCLGGISMAKVPLDEIALGGITPGMLDTDVVAIYGEPTKENKPSYAAALGSYSKVYFYGDSVTIAFAGGRNINDPYKVQVVSITANNGWSTPSGIHVGSTERDVLNTYGSPDIHPTYGSSLPKDFPKSLWYKSVQKNYDLTFRIRTKDNKVDHISIGWNA